eukprot:TRINITY_DN56088_c0_g1_i1.p1 TRINITY_DN56088_c0_g1~~TRINITY_DN56088_c0_g1_i1.p1  ORF type:complete len:744 (-),score=107.98 TRINITY_DN56088_c0_g1_i1:258-2423(-)
MFLGLGLVSTLLTFATSEKSRLPDAQEDGIDAVKAWAKKFVLEGEQEFNYSNRTRHASPDTWDTAIVYSIQVDRFNNGNVSNDLLNLPPEQMREESSGDLRGLPNFRHGGDLQGIRDRLGYIADLRMDTLWITPIAMNNGDYHGYCVSDPTIVDPGFGSREEFSALVQEAHEMGLKVVLDIVINHLCDRNTSYTKAASHEQCANDLNTQYWSGSSSGSRFQGDLGFSPHWFPPFRTPYFFNRCGPDSLEDMQGETPAALFGDFTDGMYDYATTNWDFQEIFTAIHKHWIAFADVDGFRLDAAKHVSEDFIAYLSTELRAYAETLGKHNFLVIGEVAGSAHLSARRLGRMESDDKDPSKHGDVPAMLTARLKGLQPTYSSHRSFPLPGLNSLYNFEKSGTARDAVLHHRSSSDVAKYYDSDDYRVVMGQARLNGQDLSTVEGSMWSVLEIHDWPRFLSQDPQRTDLAIAGLAWLFTATGVPVVYYGLEQGFNGNCPGNIDAGKATDAIRTLCQGGSDDSLKRQDMFLSGPWKLLSAHGDMNNYSRVGNTTPAVSPPWQKDAYLSRTHNIYTSVRKFAALRRSCSTLGNGIMVWRDAADLPGGHMAYSRISYEGLGHEMFIVVNPGGAGNVQLQSYPIDGKVNQAAGQVYRNAFNPANTAYTAFENGQAVLRFNGLNVDGGSLVVFMHESTLGSFDAELGVALCKSSLEQVVQSSEQVPSIIV